MLHNNGHYEPNEVPVIMGAPVHVSQLSAPVNVVQSMNNSGGTTQDTSQTAAEDFILPNYPSYTGPSQHLGSQMDAYPNYHGSGLQSSFMAQNLPTAPNFMWQNGMLPVHSNANEDLCEKFSNYPHFSKTLPNNISSVKEQNHSSKVCINVPQLPNNFQRQVINESDSNLPLNIHHQSYFDSLSKDQGTKAQCNLLNDNNRRKNLENTVRLIEDILISTTKNREIELEKQSKQIHIKNEESITENHNQESTVGFPEEKVKHVPKSSNIESEINSSNSGDENVHSEINIKIDDTENIVENLNIQIKLEPEDVSEIQVKIEPISSWTDTESSNPFHRDVNGILRDDMECGDYDVVDADISVSRAEQVIENGEVSTSYFECPICHLLLVHPKRFLIHTKWHKFGLNNEKRVVLDMETERQKKTKEVTQRDNSTRRTWPCKDCDKVFYARGGLESHRKRYHTNRTHECKMCSKLITGWAPWRAHMATHNTESGYQCPNCPKRFKYPHSLAKHRDTHAEKTHECSECPKKFGSPALLKVHMKSHERALKVASFHCSFCGKAFFDNFNLQIHERTHTNERPFVCTICNAAYRCNSNLSRHMKVSHSSKKPYECSICHRSFALENIRDRHELRAHGDPEAFKFVCTQCPSRYLKSIELRKHRNKVHPKPKSKKSSDDVASKD